MPTPKATHIAKPLVPTLNPKLVKECVFPNAERKRKHGHTTLCISNSGFSAILERKTINQRSVLSDSLVG